MTGLDLVKDKGRGDIRSHLFQVEITVVGKSTVRWGRHR